MKHPPSTPKNKNKKQKNAEQSSDTEVSGTCSVCVENKPAHQGMMM